jgi:outer membrane protein assembly complex protein YaeT
MCGWPYVLFLCLPLWIASAQAISLDESRDPPIAGIELEGFDTVGLGRQEALEYIGLQPQQPFSAYAVRRVVKLLYQLGLFGQVRVLARKTPAGVVLVFSVEAKRRILSVEIVGAKAVSKSELKRLSRLARGEEYDHWKMAAGIQDMLALYRSQGYRNTRIVSEIDSTTDTDVRYFVQEGRPTRISKVKFRGRRIFSLKKLHDLFELKSGDVLGEESLKRAVARLERVYFDQKYLEVKIRAPKLDGDFRVDREVLALTIEPGPKVEILMEGNQLFRDREILNTVTPDGPVRLNGFALRDLRDKIEMLYRRHAYTRTRVKVQVQCEGKTVPQAGSGLKCLHRKIIRFRIEEGQRVRVRSIDFEGNHQFSDSELRAYVHDAMVEEISQSALFQPIDRGDLDPFGGGHPLRGQLRSPNRPQGFLFELVPETIFLRKAYEQALSAIRSLYMSHGYLSVEVDEPMMSYDTQGSNLYITIALREGPQTKIKSIAFAGNQAMGSGVLMNQAEALIRPGGPLDLYAIELLRRQLRRTYANQGYVYCRVSIKRELDEESNLVAVRFVFQEGPKVKVGRLIVRGNLVTDKKVFDAVLALKPGQTYTPEKVFESQSNLNALGVFSGLDIKMLDPDQAEPVKNVVVHVHERLPHYLELGPGFSTGEGARMSVAYTHRNLFGYALESVNRARVSKQILSGLGILSDRLENTLQAMSFVESLEFSVLAGLHWPRMWFLESNLTGRVDLVGLREYSPTFSLLKGSIIAGVDAEWLENLDLTFEYEVEHIDLEYPGDQDVQWFRDFHLQEGTQDLGILRFDTVWDLRDNPFNPRKGSLLGLRVELGHSFGQDKDSSTDNQEEFTTFFLMLDGRASAYIPLSRQTTLALSLRAGIILRPDWAHPWTPSHRRFYMGGRNTLRGFDEDSLRPVNQTCSDITTLSKCFPLGGERYLLFKVEYRFPLLLDILDGAFFADLGNLWMPKGEANADSSGALFQFEENDFFLRSTAGFGVRLNTPIGPLTLDFGFNLKPINNEPNWNVHFNVGVF